MCQRSMSRCLFESVYAGASYCASLGVASLCVSRSLVVSLRKQESLPVTLEHLPTPRAARYINI